MYLSLLSFLLNTEFKPILTTKTDTIKIPIVKIRVIILIVLCNTFISSSNKDVKRLDILVLRDLINCFTLSLS